VKSGKGKEISQGVAKLNLVERLQSSTGRITRGSEDDSGKRGRAEALCQVVGSEGIARERSFSRWSVESNTASSIPSATERREGPLWSIGAGFVQDSRYKKENVKHKIANLSTHSLYFPSNFSNGARIQSSSHLKRKNVSPAHPSITISAFTTDLYASPTVKKLVPRIPLPFDLPLLPVSSRAGQWTQISSCNFARASRFHER